MRVVHDARDLGGARGKKLHAPWDAGVREALAHLPLPHAESLAGGDGAERILHVEEARHGEEQLFLPTWRVSHEMDASACGPHVTCPDVGSALCGGTLCREGQQALADPRVRECLVRTVHVQVHRSYASLVKDAQLA